MKYYEVTTAFFDNGRVSAAITDEIERASKPKTKMHSGRRADIYRDYFATLADAREFVAEAERA